MIQLSYQAAGAALHYAETGSGQETLLFLHGNGEDFHCFDKQIPAFEGEYRLLLPDSRGQGSSERGEEAPSLSRIAEDMIALLDEKKVKRVSVIGFSDGANVAMELALRHPQRISRLVLAGGNLNPWGVKLHVQLPIVMGYALCRFFGLFSKQARDNAEILRLMVREPHIRPEELSTLTMPVLVLAGERDMIRDSHTRLIHASIPGAVLRVIPGANHFLFGQWAGEANRLIAGFLKGALD